MHSVFLCSLPVWRRSLLKKGNPRDLFLPRPWPIWPKNNNTCKGPWVLHPYQVSSKSIKRFWRRSRKCKKFTDDGRTTDGRRTDNDDGRTDDGRRSMTIAHLSLWLRWANKKFSVQVGSWYTGMGGGEPCSIDKKSKGCRLTTHKIRYSRWKITSIVHFLIKAWNFASW